ncbi:hypothetical protein LSAT2_017207 [Lamellibrachia satsuma]|nr:hypothetical protein LSAT2_017207 [Lamellibrachia satsuma]
MLSEMLPDVAVTMSSSDVVMMTTLQKELPVSDSESPYQTSNIPVDDVTVPNVKSFTSTPVVASTPVVIIAPPTMAPVTPSVQMETLSSVLDIMGNLLPRLQSCCCGFDMAENQTSATPPYDDVTMSSPGVDVTVSSPHVDVTMSSSDFVVMTTLQEELPGKNYLL